MQKFEMPKMDVEEFEIVDVIMTSLDTECTRDGLDCSSETDFDW